MRFEETPIPGCLKVFPALHEDARGRLVKLFQQSRFERAGCAARFTEIYYSISRRNVVRGLHFQAPPAAHDKLVCCLGGRVWDVVLDLRRSSPTYGQHFALEMDATRAHALFVPAGLAHGFLALSDSATLAYHVTSEYNAAADCGILWNSAGIPWPCHEPILSDRDTRFVKWEDFVSPFVTDQVQRFTVHGSTVVGV